MMAFWGAWIVISAIALMVVVATAPFAIIIEYIVNRMKENKDDT